MRLQENEILKLTDDATAVTIVDNMLFIGPDDDDTQENDVVVNWHEGQLSVNKYPLTPAMVQILKMYLDQQI